MALPDFNADLFSEHVIAEPYGAYARLRDAGPVVRLTRHDCLGVARYEDVREVLSKPDVFISSQGTTLNPAVNQSFSGNLLMEDGETHRRMRKVFLTPIIPREIKRLSEAFQATADSVVASLLTRGKLEGVTELCQHLPLNLVADLVGVEPSAKERMMDWASAAFDRWGPPDNKLTLNAAEMAQELNTYVEGLERAQLTPDGWAARLFDEADKGTITHEEATRMLFAYLIPSLDTTIHGTASLLLLLGRNPDQYQALRKDPELIPNAVNEALRLESPARCFCRVASEPTELAGAEIAKGERLLLVIGAANRDDRVFDDPNRFDVTRHNAFKQIAFGHGIHACAGMHLARMEMACILQAIVNQVDALCVGEPAPLIHNIIRGQRSLPLEFVAAE